MFAAFFCKEIWKFFNCKSYLPEISYKFMFFGDFSDVFEWDMNILFLYGKYYHYVCKCKNQLPSMFSFISLLKSEAKTEAYYALSRG